MLQQKSLLFVNLIQNFLAILKCKNFTIKDYNIEDILYPEDEDAPTEEEFIETLKLK